MISLIVCSRKTDIPQVLKDNVVQTIGDTPFEWIVIDNSKNRYSIFQAYNEGVRRAKGEILCFMHDDILYHSENWGNKVCEYFDSYPNLGCLGVAGSHLLLDTPSSYWHSEAFCKHYYSRDVDGNLELIGLPDDNNIEGLAKVASVDGLWLCIPKSLFNTIRFDDVSFDGFHCYDSDICMQILQAGYDIGIAFGVAVEHSKRGSQNACYFKNIRIWYDKWKHFLPVARGKEFSAEDIATRTYLVKQIVALEEQVYILGQVRDSMSYRLGKMLLNPIKKMKKS